jgi:hypothetical protein
MPGARRARHHHQSCSSFIGLWVPGPYRDAPAVAPDELPAVLDVDALGAG